MEEKTPDFEEQTEEQTTSIIKVEELSLEDTQLAEQLYNSAGLDPVVDAGLKDYDKRIQIENKLINKVLGTRGSDIRGYGEAVAKRVSLAIYDQLNRQYGGKVGNLRSYIMSLEEDRDRANTRYDELMGRVIGILGDEYKALRTDSNTFMEKLTTLMGEDREAAKIDQKELAERLADIDGLRAQIQTLTEEKKQQKESSEAEMVQLKKEHAEELKKLQAQISRLETKIERLEAEKNALSGDLKKLSDEHRQLIAAMSKLVSAVPSEGMGKNMGEELYSFVLKDSKVPDVVIEGVGKFIDFKRYLGEAVERGAKEVCRRVEETLKVGPTEKE